MRRFAIILSFACFVASLGIFAGSAKAGDYYGDAYYRHHRGNVWYSSSCCYRKIVRHERRVRYVRVDEGRSYYRDGYYEQPYRRRYTHVSPRRYVNDAYVTRSYVSGSYNGYRRYDDNCYRRRVKVLDGRGGWVWGVRLNCY